MLEIDWYELPLAHQRFYQLYMQSNQNPTLLTIGGLYPLNLVTGVQVQHIKYFDHSMSKFSLFIYQVYNKIYSPFIFIYTMVMEK